jgi:hypothetical protein
MTEPLLRRDPSERPTAAEAVGLFRRLFAEHLAPQPQEDRWDPDFAV